MPPIWTNSARKRGAAASSWEGEGCGGEPREPVRKEGLGRAEQQRVLPARERVANAVVGKDCLECRISSIERAAEAGGSHQKILKRAQQRRRRVRRDAREAEPAGVNVANGENRAHAVVCHENFATKATA